MRNQRGASLVMIAIMALGLTAATGMAADAGVMFFKRTRMQAATDAAALAGAYGLLKDKSEAVREAQKLASANGYKLESKDISFPPGSRIRVGLKERTPLLLGPLLGMENPTVGATSGGELHCVTQSAGIRPWGIPDIAFLPGREYALKNGAGGATRGNFSPLAPDGPGASTYFQAILSGSKTDITAGQLVKTQPGNIQGPTATAVNQLIGRDRASYEEAIRPGATSPRVVKIALLDPNSNASVTGRSDVRVTGFARFYLTYTGSRGEVYGRFVDRVVGTTVPGTAAQYAVRLVE